MKSKTSDDTAGSVVLQRMVRARGQASREGMALCLKWIDSCREMGWAEDQFNDLEDLFWKYRDPDGRLRPNVQHQRPATEDVQNG